MTYVESFDSLPVSRFNKGMKIFILLCIVALAACQKPSPVSSGKTTYTPEKSPQYKMDGQKRCLIPSIVGGQRVEESNPLSEHVVLVLTTLYERQKAVKLITCTGALIAPDTVLTAAHCFNVGNYLAVTEIVASTNMLCSSGFDKRLIYSAKDVIIHPQYQKNSEPSDYAPYNDLALVKFNGVLPNKYKALTFSKLNPRELPNHPEHPLIQAGYGKTSSSKESAPELRFVSKASSQIFLSRTDVSTGKTYDLISDLGVFGLRQLNAQGVCKGDSGGPLLIKNQNQYEILGVASYIDNGNNCEKSNSYYTYIETYRNWITSQL